MFSSIYIITKIEGSLNDPLKYNLENSSTCNTVFTAVTNLETDANEKNCKITNDDNCALVITDKLDKNKKQNQLNKTLKNWEQLPVKNSSYSSLNNKTKISSTISSTNIQKSVIENIEMDKVAIIICMTTRSARMFITANNENLSTEYPEMMFNLPKTEVLYYNAAAQLSVGVLTCVMLLIYALTSYTKKYVIVY